jgi:hypothetical protein
MNSKDIKTIFSILGADVTAVSYIKDGYTIVIAPPVKEAAVPNSLNEELKKVFDRADPGTIDCSNYVLLQKAFDKYANNQNYELYITDNKLCVRQHDLGGCTHAVLVANLTYWDTRWCETAGILIR